MSSIQILIGVADIECVYQSRPPHVKKVSLPKENAYTYRSSAPYLTSISMAINVAIPLHTVAFRHNLHNFRALRVFGAFATALGSALMGVVGING